MVSSENSTDDLIDRFEQTLEAARHGGQNAVGSLLDFYRGYLLTFATRKLSRELAVKRSPSDLVQETLIKASREFGQFGGLTETDLQLWLKKILMRKLVDAYRFYQVSKTRQISREVPLPDEALPTRGGIENAGEDLMLQNEKIDLLLAVFRELDEIHQQVIRLRIFEKKSFEVIGLTIGRSPEAARKLWARSILRLAKEFRAHESGTRIGT